VIFTNYKEVVMKNRLIGKGILAIVLVFGFFVIGCPTDPNNPGKNNMTKFEGTS
jgi:hypothetical protein